MELNFIYKIPYMSRELLSHKISLSMSSEFTPLMFLCLMSYMDQKWNLPLQIKCIVLRFEFVVFSDCRWNDWWQRKRSWHLNWSGWGSWPMMARHLLMWYELIFWFGEISQLAGWTSLCRKIYALEYCRAFTKRVWWNII